MRELDRLREMDRMATAAPWDVEAGGNPGLERITAPAEAPPADAGDVAIVAEYMEPDDAAIIATMRNCLPALLEFADDIRHEFCDGVPECDCYACMLQAALREAMGDKL